MDSASDLANCKTLLEKLEEAERVTTTQTLIKLANIFEHLPPQVAPRLQKDYDYCTTRSDEILGNLFDKVEISDKNVLNLLLRLLLAYGNFRLAQITYYIDSYRDEIEPNTRYTPIIVKTKWHDLTPLLPAAGTLDWKSIFTHGFVKDSDHPKLSQTCSQLLIQKLHFYGIISMIDRFRFQRTTIHKNGVKVAEKLAENIFDCANDDQEVVNIDSFIFNLLTPFTTDEQQAALIEAIIIARFKTDLPEELHSRQLMCISRLDTIFSECLMNKAKLQEVFFVKLIEQLKCNVIRRKRRHSVEEVEEGVTCTLEGLLGDITKDSDPTELVGRASNIILASKNLQRGYLKQWVAFLHETLTKKTLTPKSSILLVQTTSVLLICTSKLIDDDLNTELSLLLAKTLDSTNPKRLDKFFKPCGPAFLSNLTKGIAESTELLEHFDTPVTKFYRSYFARYMRQTAAFNYKKDVEKFAQFVDFICDKTTIGKSKSHVLEYMFLIELSNTLEFLRQKGGNKLTDLYVEYGKTISKRLYKFIKHRPFVIPEYDEDDKEKPTNGGNGDSDASDHVQTVVITALVCILKIAVERKDQQMLDTYGELMLKVYNLMCMRFEELIDITRYGLKSNHKAVDMQLYRLINLYETHRATIEPYLCYELNEKIIEKLIIAKVENMKLNGTEETDNELKESIYNDVKKQVKSLADKDTLVYQSIINSQYSTVVEQSISQVNDMDREDLCYKRYMDHLATISHVLVTLFHNCDLKMYDKVMSNLVKQYECCDALHHPQVLNLFHMLESVIPRGEGHDANLVKKANSFKKAFPTIGCCLIRIAKSVELGPSVISFSHSGNHKSNGGIQCCTYSHCIRIYALVFNRFPPAFTNSLITDAMQICISANLTRYAKYSHKLFRFFIQLASSMAKLLKAVCMGKRDVVEHAMPVFLSVFSLLIRCIILASDRKKLADMPRPKINGFAGGDTNGTNDSDADAIEEKCKIYEAQLEYLARDVGRLLNNLCLLETKLVDYAPHLISTYIKDTQRASCPDFVKKHLDEGMFRVFNLVDSYQKDRQEQVIEAGVQRKTTAGQASGSLFEMIHARLDQASREIFKDMHDNYNRFHRYLGKC